MLLLTAHLCTNFSGESSIELSTCNHGVERASCFLRMPVNNACRIIANRNSGIATSQNEPTLQALQLCELAAERLVLL